MAREFLLLCLLAASVCLDARGATVWIDTDPSIGTPWREVDDAFALVFAFHSPEVRIAGISTTYGNARLKRTTFVARDLVRRFGAPAGLTEKRVFAGAASRRDIAKRTAATEALAEALRKERLTYIALGPLTNLAAFLTHHPELASRIDQIIFVGGKSPGEQLAFGRTGWLRVHDANVLKDPAAVDAVLRTGIPLLLMPVNVSRQLALDRADLRGLRGGATAGEYLFRRTRVWSWFWTRLLHEKGGPLFDVPAVLAAIQPGLVVMEQRFARCNEAGDLIASREKIQGARRVRFAVAVHGRTKEKVIRRLRQRPPS
ncbi:MAG: nucleoside hydrolase [Chthoniobacterales bacterium]